MYATTVKVMFAAHFFCSDLDLLTPKFYAFISTHNARCCKFGENLSSSFKIPHTQTMFGNWDAQWINEQEKNIMSLCVVEA